MERFGVVVVGLLNAAHVWIEGQEVPLAYDGKHTRKGSVGVTVARPLDLRWVVAGWADNPFGIELYQLGDNSEPAKLLDTIDGNLNSKGVNSGEKQYA